MGKTRKSKKDRGPPGAVRAILAQNFLTLRNALLAHLGSETAMNKHVAKAIGSSLSQVQRIAAGDQGPSIDELDRLATLFQTTPHELITPYLFRKPIAELVAGATPWPDPKPRQPGTAIHEPTVSAKPVY